MKLAKDDAELFFRLMWDLQCYVNQQLEIIPGVDSVEEYHSVSGNAKIEVRDALWEMPELIEMYVEENPRDLPPDELAIVETWKRFVSGTFSFYRQLKKHAIFIGEGSVYGVLGLRDSPEEALAGRRLPEMVETVLMPFKGRIVYDGLMRRYAIRFGKGIRSDMHEEYMAAKQNRRIVTTLEPERRKKKRSKKQSKKEWLPVLDQIVNKVEGMRGGPAIESAAMGLLRASGRLAQAAVKDSEDVDELWALEVQVRRALTRLRRTLDRAER